MGEVELGMGWTAATIFSLYRSCGVTHVRALPRRWSAAIPKTWRGSAPRPVTPGDRCNEKIAAAASRVALHRGSGLTSKNGRLSLNCTDN